MCLPTHLALERGACCLEVFAKPVPGAAMVAYRLFASS